ncbi:MAG: histidyl-tRNA synthetase [Eubacteriales bacterium]|nr:histidyl-tRNA synthetase [Eubacteriales bacterium]MDN5364276.1 histidyl-tRNA synthetase [Eubacteriales bacterium]
MLTRVPKGTFDVLPGEVEKWQFLEETARRLCRDYGYRELRTPIFEHTELFLRGVGDTTDVVEKEMYTFQDKGGRSISLRPEGTAPAARAYLEHGLHAGPQPVKVFYIGPMFRYANVQAGRYRQFHQFGIEVFGSGDPLVDAEVVAMAMEYYRRLRLRDMELHINSVGCPHCRPVHREKLLEFLRERLEQLCADCRSRVHRNPLRVLDCKEEECRRVTEGAPTTLDYLCSECRLHFEQTLSYLDEVGVQYVVDGRLVRGLDYYTRTAFEIMMPEIGAQSSIGGGGRYDGLVAQLGGPAVPGIGFAIGLERVLAALEKQGAVLPGRESLQVFVAVVGEEARRTGFKIVQELRSRGVSADLDTQNRSLKAQMKYANRLQAAMVAIIGEEELKRGIIQLRDMESGQQHEVKIEELYSAVAKRGR